jgi:hypothetical protein
MSDDSFKWKKYLPEARAFCEQLRAQNRKPCDALTEFGVRPFGDETWPDAHRLMAKAIQKRQNNEIALLVVLDPIFYGSSSLSQ